MLLISAEWLLLNITTENNVMIRQFTQTKIVATLGPASAKKEILKKMILEGLNVCRLNFSHGTYTEHLAAIGLIRELNKELDTDVAILADLQGPKIRIGEVKNNRIVLREGMRVSLLSEECMGTEKALYINYLEFPKDVQTGEMILLNDGKIRLKVINTNRIDRVETEVINGGALSSHKGVNLPDTHISLPSLTAKDLKDAHFALKQDIDLLALSFVRSANDIVELRQLIVNEKKSVSIVAKIEKPEALENLEAIIHETDVVMVARGDLGVEVPFNEVPMIQKQIVRKSIEFSKPVIIATQMLESMVENFRPTRAEATDVANAVLDGTDAVMLSEETSVGKYPVESIISMKKIIVTTEKNGYSFHIALPPIDVSKKLPDALCNAVKDLTIQVAVDAIICFTYSGYTAVRMAAYRPDALIFAFTGNQLLMHKLSLVWGIRALFFDAVKHHTTEAAIREATHILKNQKLIENGQVVIFLGSTPILEKGKTNMIKLVEIS